MNKLIISFFLMGLSLGLGPCLVSCGPLLISYIAGTHKTVYRSALAYILFSLSRIFVYLVLGLLVFFFGQIAERPFYGYFLSYTFVFGGVFIIIIGLLMALGKNIDFKFCRRLDGLLLKKDKKTLLVLGIIIGIMPCLPLVSVLYYIGLVAKSVFDSLLYSFCFGLGTIISPLFILAALTGFIPSILSKHNKFYSLFNSLCGLILVILGAQLIIRGFR